MDYWNELIELTKKAAKKGEVPVAALIVKDGKIIAKSYNLREKKQNILGHAEIIAINKASKKLRTWKLSECELYVSLKPCKMCEEIIKQSRLKSVFYLLEKPENKKEYRKTTFNQDESPVWQAKYKTIMANFFKNLR